MAASSGRTQREQRRAKVKNPITVRRAIQGTTAPLQYWRVTIEGEMQGQPAGVKQLIADQIEAAARELPGAQLVEVTLRRSGPKKAKKSSGGSATVQPGEPATPLGLA